jgi:hypothetical protein
MAHRTHPPVETAAPKPKYRVANWSDGYRARMNWARMSRALGSRGEVTLWIDEAVLSGWRASGGRRYSDPVRAQPSRGVPDATAPDPGCPRQLQELAHDPTLLDLCAARRRAGRAADFAKLGHWPAASGGRYNDRRDPGA